MQDYHGLAPPLCFNLYLPLSEFIGLKSSKMTQHLLKYHYLIEAHAQSFQGVFFRSLNKQLQGFASKVFLFLLNDKEPLKKVT